MLLVTLPARQPGTEVEEGGQRQHQDGGQQGQWKYERHALVAGFLIRVAIVAIAHIVQICKGKKC